MISKSNWRVYFQSELHAERIILFLFFAVEIQLRNKNKQLLSSLPKWADCMYYAPLFQSWLSDSFFFLSVLYFHYKKWESIIFFLHKIQYGNWSFSFNSQNLTFFFRMFTNKFNFHKPFLINFVFNVDLKSVSKNVFQVFPQNPTFFLNFIGPFLTEGKSNLQTVLISREIIGKGPRWRRAPYFQNNIPFHLTYSMI